MTETRIICDKCKEEIQLGREYFQVEDWIGRAALFVVPTQHLDICSRGCLVKLLDDRLAQSRNEFETIKIIPAKICTKI